MNMMMRDLLFLECSWVHLPEEEHHQRAQSCDPISEVFPWIKRFRHLLGKLDLTRGQRCDDANKRFQRVFLSNAIPPR